MSDIARAVAIRRGLRNLDAVGAEPGNPHARSPFEIELGRAYDAGHIAGSGVKNQTDAEQHLAEVARQLTAYQAHAIGETISPQLGEAIDALQEKHDTMPCPPPGPACGDDDCSACNVMTVTHLRGVNLDSDEAP